MTDARVQTVLGPIDPGSLGLTLPHEHTAIALWHIPNRWDYWELRRDEPIITRGARPVPGGRRRGLVDLTLPASGATPTGWPGSRGRPACDIVMGAGWYRGAHYPAGGPRRSANGRRPCRRDRPRRVRGVRGDRNPGRDHRRDRHRQAVAFGPRGTRPPSGRTGSPTDGARDHDPRRPVDGRARPAHRIRGGGRRPVTSHHRPRRFEPDPATIWRSSSAARPSSSTSSG